MIMETTVSLTDDELIAVLVNQLDEHERAESVVYYSTAPIAGGEIMDVPRVELTAPWDAFVAFVDQDPMANWSHSCRYVLIGRDTGEVMSIQAQLPPFASRSSRPWRVAYKAAAIPDAVLMIQP
jgi:hypothetical protein